jgi:hypothetical protein
MIHMPDDPDIDAGYQYIPQIGSNLPIHYIMMILIGRYGIPGVPSSFRNGARANSDREFQE